MQVRVIMSVGWCCLCVCVGCSPVGRATSAKAASRTAVEAADEPVLADVESGRRMQVGTNFWNLGWGIWNDVFKSDATFLAGSNPWNSTFLEELKPYSVLRFMDWSHTNNSQETTWSQRSQPEVPATPKEPLAWEWTIDLCNRLNKDLWVNVPHGADANYAKKLAELIHGRLDPELSVYVEWSNESWNGGFEQAKFAKKQGARLGFDEPGADYHVYAAVRVFEQFEQIYGSDDARLVTVIAGQAVNTWLTERHLEALGKTAVNPHGIRPDAYGIAPYFGGKVEGNAVDAVSQLRADIDAKISVVAKQSQLVRQAGIRLIAYEGGQHVTSGADVINADPEMYQLYGRYLKGIAPNLDVFAHYLHNGQWSGRGAWGAEQYVGQPRSEAHKLRALYDFIDTQN